MKEEFEEYFPLTDKEINHIWKEGIIIFDSSTLLNLYEYPEDIREKFFKILEKVKSQLWIPYQFAYEYHKNRPSTVQKTMSKIDEYKNSIKGISAEAITKISNLPSNSLIDREGQKERIEELFSKIEKEIEAVDKTDIDFRRNDKIRDKLYTYFNKIGQKKTENELKVLYEEADKRYLKKIPPGYMDGKKDEPEKYGDFIAWNEIIERAKEEKKKIIFITEDEKEDWWEKHKNPIPPRVELRKELIQIDSDLIMYNFKKFLETGAKRFEIEIDDEDIEELEEVSKRKKIDLKRFENKFPRAKSEVKIFKKVGESIEFEGMEIELYGFARSYIKSPDGKIVDKKELKQDESEATFKINGTIIDLKEGDTVHIDGISIKVIYIANVSDNVITRITNY